MKFKKQKPCKVGTAKRQKERKALRGQLNDLDIENRLLRKENRRLETVIIKAKNADRLTQAKNSQLTTRVEFLEGIIERQKVTIKQLRKEKG